MVIRCSVCNKVRKYGIWIKAHPDIAEQMKNAETHHTFCPDCESAFTEGPYCNVQEQRLEHKHHTK